MTSEMNSQSAQCLGWSRQEGGGGYKRRETSEWEGEGGCTRGGRRVNGKGRGDKDRNEKLEGTSNRMWVGGERGGKF